MVLVGDRPEPMSNSIKVLFNLTHFFDKGVTTYLVEVIQGGRGSSSMTLETNFCSDDPSLNQEYPPPRGQVDHQASSDTNLRYLSEVNEPCPLRPKVDLQVRASFLVLSLSGGATDLSRYLKATFTRVNLHLVRCHTPFDQPWTLRRLGQQGQLWG
jgi:hypothetical protein